MSIQYVDDLLKDYEKNKKIYNAKKLKFLGVGNKDVYNPTSEFEFDGLKLIVGRVEDRTSELSKTIFFEKIEPETYKVYDKIPAYDLQDPFITKVDNLWVFGGTKVFPHPDNPNNLWWKTEFYCGESLYDLKLFAEGPNGMKDIRIVDMGQKGIGIFTRPQGKIGGRGKIGFTIINQLNDLSVEVIEKAELLELFDDEEWGGANQCIMLDENNIGVLGHIAKFTVDGSRHYYPMVFTLNVNTGEPSEMKIIAARKDLLDGPHKREDLIDVLFSGGLNIDGKKAELFVGVSDAHIQVIEIDNPF